MGIDPVFYGSCHEETIRVHGAALPVPTVKVVKVVKVGREHGKGNMEEIN